jgi:glutathione S-transferase
MLQPSYLAPVFFPILTGTAGPGDPGFDKARVTFEKRLDVLEAQLGDGPWVLGQDFTLADIEVGLPLYRYFTADMPRRDLPNLAGYYTRLCERPAYAVHVMVPYDILKSLRT